MRSKRILCFLISAAILSIAAFSTSAQTARANFNRARTFDVQHYLVLTSFDRAKRKVFGDTTVSLKPLADGFRVVELDAVSLAFNSVKLEPSGTDLKFKLSTGKVEITLDRTYDPSETVSIRLKYTASPKKGVYFVDAETDPQFPDRSAQIWTQAEPDEARHWFPSFDFPSDKATTEQYVTAEIGETVVGNGELVDKTDNADGTETWHYKMPVPHSTYLVSFVIGKFARVDDRYKQIPLGFFVYPGKEQSATKAFGQTKEMIRAYEELTGIPFAFNKYDQTIVAQFHLGGMENITATTFADEAILLAGTPFGDSIVNDLVSHELAHSWFGNLVTCRNWAELWLNEGFATYMEAAYREKAYGRDSYLRKVRSDAAQFLVNEAVNKKKFGLYNRRAGNVSELFDNPTITYNKGAAVLHTLREQVGTEAFWKAVNIYLNRHKFANVESTDLKQAMEETSGQSLGWFFDQWVYGIGAPRLDVGQTYNPRTKMLAVTVTQTQPHDSLTPAVFRLPLAITVETPVGEIRQNVELTKRNHTYSFKTAIAPTGLIIDPDEKIPLKRVKIRPITPRR